MTEREWDRQRPADPTPEPVAWALGALVRFVRRPPVRFAVVVVLLCWWRARRRSRNRAAA